MKEQIQRKLNDSWATRWGALSIVAFTMMAAYYVNDVTAPLKPCLKPIWDGTVVNSGFSPEPIVFKCLLFDADLGRTDS